MLFAVEWCSLKGKVLLRDKLITSYPCPHAYCIVRNLCGGLTVEAPKKSSGVFSAWNNTSAW